MARFLVHSAWTQSFFSEARGNVRNERLVDTSCGCHACGQVVLRRGIQEGRDYGVVDASPWAGTIKPHHNPDYEIRRFLVPRTKTDNVKGEKQRAKTTKGAGKSTASEAKLDLFPAHIVPPYWDEAAGKPVTCRHAACGHVLRLECSRLFSYSTVCELARDAIDKHTSLDADTLEWITLGADRGHRVDLMYWNLSYGDLNVEAVAPVARIQITPRRDRVSLVSHR